MRTALLFHGVSCLGQVRRGGGGREPPCASSSVLSLGGSSAPALPVPSTHRYCEVVGTSTVGPPGACHSRGT